MERGGLAFARAIINKHTAGKKIAVAVSGGMDSMCLIHLVLECENIDKKNVCVAHINHNLRGENSQNDLQFVSDFCARESILFLSKNVDIAQQAAARGHSIELEARLCRREFYAELINGGFCSMVLTAHHALDNAETMLFRVFRKTGIKGLKCMGVFNEEKTILRPLIHAKKSEITEYVSAHKIHFRTDESNSDNAFDRNYIRNEIVPLIEKRWNIYGAALALSSAACDDDDYINSQLDFSKVSLGKNSADLSADCFLHRALAVRYLGYAMKNAFDNAELSGENIARVYQLSKGGNGKRVCVGGLVFSCENGAVNISCAQGEKNDSEVEFCADGTSFMGMRVQAISCESKPKKGLLVCDLDKLPVGAVVRLRRDGDVFVPFGGGEKKLKKYFIDKKISRRIRDTLPLIALGNEVLAILGVEISDRIRLDECTKRAVQLLAK